MDRRQIGLKLVMDELGLPVSVKEFRGRLVLQKAIYLAQAAGVNLGYYYRWYLYGPYCPGVAEDGFAISIELTRDNDPAKEWVLEDASKGKLKRVRRLISGSKKHLAKKLELLASVHFLMDRGQVAEGDTKGIAETLERYGKAFNEQEVVRSIGELKAHGITS